MYFPFKFIFFFLKSKFNYNLSKNQAIKSENSRKSYWKLKTPMGINIYLLKKPLNLIKKKEHFNSDFLCNGIPKKAKFRVLSNAVKLDPTR